MVDMQDFTCSTPDCMYWSDEGCSKGSITIEEHHCVDFEEKPKTQVVVTVSGGMVQNIYSSLTAEEFEVEILDYDDAKQKLAEDATERREESLKKRLNHVY